MNPENSQKKMAIVPGNTVAIIAFFLYTTLLLILSLSVFLLLTGKLFIADFSNLYFDISYPLLKLSWFFVVMVLAMIPLTVFVFRPVLYAIIAIGAVCGFVLVWLTVSFSMASGEEALGIIGVPFVLGLVGFVLGIATFVFGPFFRYILNSVRGTIGKILILTLILIVVGGLGLIFKKDYKQHADCLSLPGDPSWISPEFRCHMHVAKTQPVEKCSTVYFYEYCYAIHAYVQGDVSVCEQAPLPKKLPHEKEARDVVGKCKKFYQKIPTLL